MPEMHLRQPEFPHSACGPFTKNNERMQKFKIYIYQNILYKACFQHGMAYGGFSIAKNPKYNGY